MIENTLTVSSSSGINDSVVGYSAPILSLSSMAMLVELRISTWTARKRDEESTTEVNNDKGASHDAGAVYKYLMAGSNHLEKINKYAAKCRAWHGSQTLPWMKGVSLLPMENFFKYREQLGTMEANFHTLISEFLAEYPKLVNTQAFKLGKYYRADEFPHVDSLPNKFKFVYNFLPVPESGDFRINCESRVKADLQEQYDKMFQDKIKDAMRDPWDRLHNVLTHLVERLEETPEGQRKVFRDSVLTNAIEMCDVLTRLNVTKDPKLEEARRMLERAISGMDADDLRKIGSARVELHSSVKDILDKFNW
jgi:hypothetical protein